MKRKIFNNSEIKILLVISLICLVIWVSGLFFVGTTKELGDRASALDALFSAAGLIGLLATLYLQRKELAYQRRELRLTRRELALTRDEVRRSAEAQQKSERALASQAKSLMFSARLNAVSAVLSVYENRHSQAMNLKDEINIRIAELNREKYRMSLEALGDELIFINQCEIFSPVFAIVSITGNMIARINNEISTIQRKFYDEYQFMSLFNSISQECQAIVEAARETPLEVRSAISRLIHAVVAYGDELISGRKSNLEKHIGNSKTILKFIEELRTISTQNLSTKS